MYNKELEISVINRDLDPFFAKEISGGNWEINGDDCYRIKIVDQWDNTVYFDYFHPEMMADDLNVLLILKMNISQAVVNEASRLMGRIWEYAISDGNVQEPYWY